MNNIKLALALLVLTACSPVSDSERYETINTSKWNTATIEVNWFSSVRAVSEKCASLGTNDGPNDSPQKYNGCARTKPTDSRICEVYAVEPKNFDDTHTLEIFGHEVWHCFGAKHK